MKRLIFTTVLTIGIALGVSAQHQHVNNQQHIRIVEVYDYDGLKLHVYSSFEDMADVSIIVESKEALVILEPEAFTHCKSDYEAYIKQLSKPVAKIIADYHTAGLADWDPKLVVMVDGMLEFEKSPAHKEREKRFAEIFKGVMDTRPHNVRNTVSVPSIQKWAGVSFRFDRGANTDFPAATINIDGKFYYFHYAPQVAHITPFQINSVDAIDAQIAELQKARASGCTLFVGGHGSPQHREAVDFQISYLQKMKSIRKTAKTKEEFIQTMKNIFYALPGENYLVEVAEILYQ